MNLHKHQMYLLEQHSESFNIWSAIIRISTEGKSSIMTVGLGSSNLYLVCRNMNNVSVIIGFITWYYSNPSPNSIILEINIAV